MRTPALRCETLWEQVLRTDVPRGPQHAQQTLYTRSLPQPGEAPVCQAGGTGAGGAVLQGARRGRGRRAAGVTEKRGHGGAGSQRGGRPEGPGSSRGGVTEGRAHRAAGITEGLGHGRARGHGEAGVFEGRAHRGAGVTEGRGHRAAGAQTGCGRGGPRGPGERPLEGDWQSGECPGRPDGDRRNWRGGLLPPRGRRNPSEGEAPAGSDQVEPPQLRPRDARSSRWNHRAAAQSEAHLPFSPPSSLPQERPLLLFLATLLRPLWAVASPSSAR